MHRVSQRWRQFPRPNRGLWQSCTKSKRLFLRVARRRGNELVFERIGLVSSVCCRSEAENLTANIVQINEVPNFLVEKETSSTRRAASESHSVRSLRAEVQAVVKVNILQTSRATHQTVDFMVVNLHREVMQRADEMDRLWGRAPKIRERVFARRALQPGGEGLIFMVQ